MIFGIQTMKILEFYLEKHDIEVDRVAYNIEKFEEVLYGLFGNGAELIIKEIIKMLYNEFNVSMPADFSSLKEALLLLKEQLE